MLRTTLSVVGLLCWSGCTQPSPVVDAAMDQGVTDTAVGPDGQADAETDAGTPTDTGPVDTGMPYDAGPRQPYDPMHTFPAISLAAGGESLSHCQSWRLNNPTELWVNSVQMTAGPGWHHSNWVFVPENAFDGPDGTWECRARNFDEVTASAMGGVFFAQSTQATSETQQFPPGAAYRIPPYAKVIGSVHILNLTAQRLNTTLQFRIGDIPQAQVTTVLNPLAIDNRGIELAPRATSTMSTECNIAFPYMRRTQRNVDFSVYYVLPHYHTLARSMRVEVVGGPRDGQVVFETMTSVGEALGRTLPTPFDLTGATGLRVKCSYQNPSDLTLTWGPQATDEMCTLLAYTNAASQLGGLAANPNVRTTNPDGSRTVESPCIVLAQ